MKIKEISAKETLTIRQRILRPHQNIEECIYDKDDDKNTIHLGVFRQSELVAIATFQLEINSSFVEQEQYRLRGMAVLPKYQGKGVGGKLLSFGLKKLQKRESNLVWCNGRIKARDFYLANGFSIKGDKFELPGIGVHYLMYKRYNINLNKKQLERKRVNYSNL